MASESSLPTKINHITVCAGDIELGVLTHGSVHHYQPKQDKRHVSLTMTQKGMDGYSAGAVHAKVNDMYLLALQGDHSVGMLSYQSELVLPETESVSLNDILSYKSAEPLFPQLLEKYYLRNSLAGVQPKVSIPSAGIIKTSRTVEQKDLIVKAFDAEFPLLTVNEFVCMEAARHCGLEPPKTYLSENLETFVIERFDKADNGTKLGYEDFTTLLKKSNDPDAKYSSSYETLLKATHLYTNNQAEVEKMYQYIVFNCLIGNGDAHLKNFALQYEPDMSRIFVSPPFDITHTVIYDAIDNKMALKLANSKAFPDEAHLLKLAEGEQFRIRKAKDIIESTSDGIMDYLKGSDAVCLFAGLRESIERSVSSVLTPTYSTKNYRHDRKKKFE
jgi:serine/threonine-protein kinase HipA